MSSSDTQSSRHNSTSTANCNQIQPPQKESTSPHSPNSTTVSSTPPPAIQTQNSTTNRTTLSINPPTNTSTHSDQRIKSLGNTSSAYDNYENPNNETYRGFYEANTPRINQWERCSEDEGLSADAVYLVYWWIGGVGGVRVGYFDSRDIGGVGEEMDVEEEEEEGG